MNLSYRTFPVLLLLFSLLFTSCKKDGDKVVYQFKEDFTLEDRKDIGSIIKTSIEENPSEFPLLDKAVYKEFNIYLNQHLGAITNTITVKTREVFDWDVTVIQNDEMEIVFSAPGGHLFISTGILKFIKNESQLIALLAHEVNYAENEILMNKMFEEYEAKDMSNILFGRADDILPSVGPWLRDLAFSKEEVLDADAFGIELICPFNYQATGIKSIIELALESNQEMEWLNTRPSDASRISVIENIAIECSDDETPTGEERYQSFINKLP